MSAKKEKSAFPPEKLALYDRLIETIPNLERKGAAVPYTSLNGHMFSFINTDGALALRLPQAARENFLAEYHASLAVSYSTVMKEWVSVPEELFQNTQELQKYFELSYEHVKSLKPKPTTRKKAAG
jgi:TfoX/Sxy family transcriptional regulator of competence genes